MTHLVLATAFEAATPPVDRWGHRALVTCPRAWLFANWGSGSEHSHPFYRMHMHPLCSHHTHMHIYMHTYPPPTNMRQVIPPVP